jgi:hypothetical protein
MKLRFSVVLHSIILGSIVGAPHAFAQVAKSPGQPALKTTEPWTPPRTPDGHPDLHGFWTNATITPLERSKELGNKEFYTEAEAKDVERQFRFKAENQPKDDIHYDDRTWQDESYGKGLTNRRTSMIFDPPDGKLPPLSEKGKQRAVLVAKAAKAREAAASYTDRTLAERCITWGNEGPPMIGATYNANMQIEQTGDSIAIFHELMHGYRVIPMDGRPHLPPGIQQMGGDSRGHWDGDTLIVDTTNFSDKTNFRGPPSNTRQDIFSSPEMHVVERFKMIDAETIAYSFTVEDPGTWSKPWSGELYMHRFEGPIYEYACHEGNYGLANILEAARKRDREAASKPSK